MPVMRSLTTRRLRRIANDVEFRDPWLDVQGRMQVPSVCPNALTIRIPRIHRTMVAKKPVKKSSGPSKVRISVDYVLDREVVGTRTCLHTWPLSIETAGRFARAGADPAHDQAASRMDRST